MFMYDNNTGKFSLNDIEISDAKALEILNAMDALEPHRTVERTADELALTRELENAMRLYNSYLWELDTPLPFAIDNCTFQFQE